MKRLLLFLIFISMPLGDQVDEMEELILNQPELIVYPEVLYKNGGLWFSANRAMVLTFTMKAGFIRRTL